MGEVARPGQYEIEDEKVTILDALSKAGDLTIYGTREDVMVLRQENGHQKIYKINLCSGNSVFYTAVYYLLFVGILTILFNWLEKKLAYFK